MRGGKQMQKNEVLKIKEFVTNQVGNKVRIESNKRHNKSVINEGVISNVYASIFTLELSSDNNKTGRASKRTVSFSYTDILTNSVDLITLEGLAI